MQHNRISTIIFTITLSFATVASAQTWVSFDVPASTTTFATGINADAVVGRYVDSAGTTHGFLLKDGKVTAIDYPGAVFTAAWGINSQGDIVGIRYDDPARAGDGVAQHGFLLRGGVYTPLDYPGKFGLIPVRINDAGQIVGCNHDDGPSTGSLMGMNGFLFSNNNWSQLSMDMTMNNGITADGSLMTGLMGDSPATNHGYLARTGDNSIIMPFDFPFSTSTLPYDISPSGDAVVGYYIDAANKTHGFLLRLGGLSDAVAIFGFNPQLGIPGPFEFISIDYPGATSTYAYGINSRGDIVGRYVDSAGKTHAFFHSPGLPRTRQNQSDAQAGPLNRETLRP